MSIKAADVMKLRKATGAGMMDCKKALIATDGDFDKAIEEIRKRGQAIASKRADREATEGAVLAKSSECGKKGALIVLNCETDFVAKNENFVAFAQSILDKAIEAQPADLDALKALDLNGRTVEENVNEQTGVIGEKIDLSGYETVEAEYVASYIHAGNKLATLVGFSAPVEEQAGKDVAMQVAAMAPVSIDKDDVPQNVIDEELRVGKEKARLEGKPENMLDKIAQGRLGKFFKESTLVNQAFIKDGKMSVKQYIESVNKEAKVSAMKRVSLNA